jgi:NADH-quinone oxidoreductase subunit J
MNSTSVLFYIFAAVLLVASFCVITARSTVHAALYLVLSFFSASCLWMLLRAEFLAITLVLVYVGAVMVLFLFVVMMLDINTDSLRQGFWKHLPLAGVVGAVIALEMALVLMRGFKVQEPAAVVGGVAGAGAGAGARLVDVGNTKLLGIELYTNYLYPVQLAAVLLLVAIIAAIALTLRARKDSRHMDPSQQVRAKKADRMRLVKMQAVIEAPSLPKVLEPAAAAATTPQAAPTAPTAPAAPKPAGGAA